MCPPKNGSIQPHLVIAVISRATNRRSPHLISSPLHNLRLRLKPPQSPQLPNKKKKNKTKKSSITATLHRLSSAFNPLAANGSGGGGG